MSDADLMPDDIARAHKARVCEHAARVAGVAVLDARIESGRWQVLTPAGWLDYAVLMDAATEA